MSRMADDHLTQGSPLMDLHTDTCPGQWDSKYFLPALECEESRQYKDIIMYKQMDIGALSLNKSRLPGQRFVTFCPEHEYFILSPSDSSGRNMDLWPGYREAQLLSQFVYKLSVWKGLWGWVLKSRGSIIKCSHTEARCAVKEFIQLMRHECEMKFRYAMFYNYHKLLNDHRHN